MYEMFEMQQYNYSSNICPYVTHVNIGCLLNNGVTMA